MLTRIVRDEGLGSDCFYVESDSRLTPGEFEKLGWLIENSEPPSVSGSCAESVEIGPRLNVETHFQRMRIQSVMQWVLLKRRGLSSQEFIN